MALWIIQNGIFEWFSISHMMTEQCTLFSSIRICNIKSIWYIKLKKMAKKLIFGHLDHSKKGISMIFEWSSMSHNTAKSCTLFSSIRICNIKSIWCIKLKKTSKNRVFGYLDHSKRHFSGFWMVQPDLNDVQIVDTVMFYQDMQYQVNRMHKTQEKVQKPHFWLFGSFKKAFFWFLNDPTWVIWCSNHAEHLVLTKYAISSRSNARKSRNWPKTLWIIQKGQNAYTRRTKNFFKNQPDFSRTCGFRGEFRKSLNFRFKPSKVNIVLLDFRQNPLKVEKWLFLALYRDYWMIQIFPGKSGRVIFLLLLSFNFWPSLVKIQHAVTEISAWLTDTLTNCNVVKPRAQLQYLLNLLNL